MLKKVPYHFSTEQLELVKAFNCKQVELTQSFIENIDDHIETFTRQDFQQQWAGDIGEVTEVEVEHIAGIDEDAYDIKAVFTELMPMYQNQSMLVTYWSMFECELKKYYGRIAVSLGFAPELPKKPKNGGGSDFNHIVNSLRRLGLLENTSEEFQRSFLYLNDIVRNVRNDWVHSGGIPNRTKSAAEIAGIVLNGQQMNVSNEFIHTVLQSMRQIAQEVTNSSRQLIAEKKS